MLHVEAGVHTPGELISP